MTNERHKEFEEEFKKIRLNRESNYTKENSFTLYRNYCVENRTEFLDFKTLLMSDEDWNISYEHRINVCPGIKSAMTYSENHGIKCFVWGSVVVCNVGKRYGSSQKVFEKHIQKMKDGGAFSIEL